MPETDIWQEMEQFLADRRRRGLLRGLTAVESACGARIRVGGRDLVCLCSNDYLSLAADPAVRAAAKRAVDQWGVGAGASRLISGTTTLHAQLERTLAAFKGAEAAVVTSTGWQANHAAVAAMAGKGDLVLCDKLDHASILDAARACGAVLRTYPHGDVVRLAKLLGRLRGRHRRCLIVTDSLFSMDGDLAPLAALADLKDAHDAQLLVDEAHATGVLGDRGRGAAELLGVEGRVDVTVGTLSKALGALGGFVAGPGVLIDKIVNAGRAFIYTTALPPALCAAAIESLRIVQAETDRRTRLLAMAADLRGRLASAGLDTGASASQIIPVILGDASRAVAASKALLAEGFFVPAIRPPTVPQGASRLRVSLCAGHEEKDLVRFVSLLTG